MAICHCSIKIVSRGKGKSAVAAAAYRAGEKLTNEWDGLTHNYTKKEGVVHTEIMLPSNAPPSFSDRSTLWNSVEKTEKANNARLAREVEIALPIELSREAQIHLVREYCASQFVSKGMCADVCIHDTDGHNPHAHILLTTRPIDEHGKWLPKSKKEYMLDENGDRIKLPSGRYKTRKVDFVDWNSRENAETWRKAWADMCNAKFAEKGLDVRIDHRSFERQGIDLIPTIHEGVAVRAMEKKGIRTEKGDYNRWVRTVNAVIRGIQGKVSQLTDWIKVAKEQLSKPKPPTLLSLLNAYYDQQNAGARYQTTKVKNLQEQAKTLNYLEKNGIQTLEDLESRVQSHSETIDGIKKTMNKQKDRRDELKELLRMVDFYRENKPVADKLAAIKWKGSRAKFEAENENALRLYRMAERKLKPHVKDGKLPSAAWSKELERLTTQEKATYEKYKPIKADLDQLWKIKSHIEQATRRKERTQTQEQKHQKRKDELSL